MKKHTLVLLGGIGQGLQPDAAGEYSKICAEKGTNNSIYKHKSNQLYLMYLPNEGLIVTKRIGETDTRIPVCKKRFIRNGKWY